MSAEARKTKPPSDGGSRLLTLTGDGLLRVTGKLGRGVTRVKHLDGQDDRGSDGPVNSCRDRSGRP